jgi:pyridoxine/pyridoxamine 5'-phosphate oxidase
MIHGVAGAEPLAHRSRFPRGHGIPASEDTLLPWSWVGERLSSTRDYWVGTTKPDGAPHAMPVWALWVDGSLVFSTSPESRKARNLACDPRVTVHVERDDDVIILEGRVEEFALDEQIADLYAAKYDHRPEPGSLDDSWYRVRPRVAYAWDRDFPRTVTRFTFD